MVAVITVRKGSSLKDKNIRFYKGKPLLVNCVEKCLSVFDRVVVISDTTKYTELLNNYKNVEIFIDKEVGDREDVTVRLRKWANEKGYKGRMILCQCTSPNIEISSYERMRELSYNGKDDEIFMSCIEVTQKPSAFYIVGGDGYLETAIKGMPIVSRPRQELERVYYYNGGITSFHSKQLENNSLFEGGKLIPMVIKEEEKLDIDSEDDLRR